MFAFYQPWILNFSLSYTSFFRASNIYATSSLFVTNENRNSYIHIKFNIAFRDYLNINLIICLKIKISILQHQAYYSTRISETLIFFWTSLISSAFLINKIEIASIIHKIIPSKLIVFPFYKSGDPAPFYKHRAVRTSGRGTDPMATSAAWQGKHTQCLHVDRKGYVTFVTDALGRSSVVARYFVISS